jgi:hypothetical protein
MWRMGCWINACELAAQVDRIEPEYGPIADFDGLDYRATE